MNTLKRLIEKHKLLLDYMMWGSLTTVISWVSFSISSLLLTAFMKNPISAASISNIISWFCVIVFAFITNKLWVFKSKSFNKKVILPEFIKFFFTRLATGILEMLAVPILMSNGVDQAVFGINGMMSKIIVTLAVIILNYIFARLVVFKKQPRREENKN